MPARNLPARPDLDQYKKQAKELLKAIRAGDREALDRLRRSHVRPDREAASVVLADAQLVIAREHGLESWPRFVEQIDTMLGERSPKVLWRRVERAVLDGDATALDALIRDHGATLRQNPGQSWVGDLRQNALGNRVVGDALPDARAIIAAKLDFDSWDRYVAFTEALRDPQSLVAPFEAAVDAIVAGDIETLNRLLHDHPALIQMRSMRRHRSTLLLYVGANGVEGYRQRTPKNAPRIAEILLDAGAEVDAVGDMYRGTTTLGLVATSVHPVQAGVQEALIDLLVARGASLDRAVAPDYTRGRVVNACLANGRGEGAALVAQRGAPLDLEGAAGVGRLDIVRTFLDEEGHLTSGATQDELKSGFAWACAYGHIDVVRFLLDRGVDVAALHRGETPLHHAAFGGHAAVVALLLERAAPVNVKDETWQGTPLDWALFSWSHAPSDERSDRYVAVVDRLIAAGAVVDPKWLDDERIAADARMVAALGGRRPR